MRKFIHRPTAILLFFLFFQLILGNFGYTQEINLNQKVYDEVSKGEIMIGYCTLNGITDTAFMSAYRKEYELYKPQKELMNQMYSLLKGINVTIVMGTWCEDSRVQVPRFMRLFDDLEHSFASPRFICVDRDKKAGEVSLEGMEILKVPTFIVFHDGKELGRIIETPKNSLEQDFLDILKK